MFAILFEVLIIMLGAVLAAGVLAWLSWTLLSRTRFPGLGPILVFAALAILRNAGDFTQTLLIFSGIFAAAAFATLFGTMTEIRHHGKPPARPARSTHRPL
jgi:hypothetical protein